MTTGRGTGLRIAMIGQRGVPAYSGGIERHVEEIGARLVERGHEVIVYCRPNYGPARPDEHRGMRLRYLRTASTKHFEAIVHSAAATRCAVRDRADVIHYHALGPGLLTAAARVGSRAAVVQTVHGLDQQREKWGAVAARVLDLGCWASARVPHATVVVSRHLEEYYRETYGRVTHYIGNGAGSVAPARGAGVERFGLTAGRYVLFVGRLVPEKAPDLLIEAFRTLDRDDLQLAVVGGSSFTDTYVEQITRLAALDPRVRMLGAVYDRDLGDLYAGAAAFVLPSTLEGMPLTLLDAAAGGVPVLASDIPPHREFVGIDRPGARLFGCGDRDDLGAALTRLLDGLEDERVGAAAAAGRVRADYDWDTSADELAELYEALAGRRGRAVAPARPTPPQPRPAPVTRAAFEAPPATPAAP